MPYHIKARKAKKLNTKFIFVSGGVISSVGKGVTTASIAALLETRGYTRGAGKVRYVFKRGRRNHPAAGTRRGVCDQRRRGNRPGCGQLRTVH